MLFFTCVSCPSIHPAHDLAKAEKEVACEKEEAKMTELDGMRMVVRLLDN